MPVLTKCPYGACWHQLNPETGEYEEHILHPEDVLEPIARGMTVDEIAKLHVAPLKAVEHVIMLIKHMMVWRGITNPVSAEADHNLVMDDYVESWGEPLPQGSDEGEV